MLSSKATWNRWEMGYILHQRDASYAKGTRQGYILYQGEDRGYILHQEKTGVYNKINKLALLIALLAARGWIARTRLNEVGPQAF